MRLLARQPLAWAIIGVIICAGIAWAATNESKDGVFVHISHGKDDPHRALMALQMADIMSEDHDVLVYFDVEAIDLVLKDAEDATYKGFQSSKQQLSTLRDKGVILMACPGCLNARGKSRDDLATGIQLADKDRFFSFTKGRILTLDY